MVARNILTEAQRSLMTAVVNRIVPAEGSTPSAGSAGAVEAIEVEVSSLPSEQRSFLDGVTAIDLLAWQTKDRGFVALDSASQDEILRAVEVERAAFFSFLVSRTYRAYYTNANVLAALGIDSGPPQPLGQILPPFDPSLLARVRVRGPFYRKVGNEG